MSTEYPKAAMTIGDREEGQADQVGLVNRFDQPFESAGQLPTGLMALEASAGTGKTYALSALAIRFIAEQGITASQLCIVSFTEAATAELRGRVRARLVEAAEYLESTSGPQDDPVLLAITANIDATERALRARRLRDAVADFDAATISTIHGFCSRVLASAGAEPLPIQSGSDDIAEVVNDILLARHVLHPGVVVPPQRVVAGVTAQLSMPDARLFAGDPTKRTTDKQLAQQACADAVCEVVPAACDEVLVRRRSRRRQTFDGLLNETRELLTGPQAIAVVRGLRERYRVVLIDEFQDTDRVQWDIFRTAFVDAVHPAAAPAPTVVLVGDPKQSIYRFRGAELSAYLDAVGVADQVATLTTNWRSDGALLDGLGHLLDGFTFGSEAVRFAPVSAAPRHLGARMHGDGGAPLQFRWVSPGPQGDLDAGTARRAVSADLIEVVADLLDGAATLPLSADPSSEHRPVHAGDIAILVRSNADASAFALALAAAGIPAATAANNSVLESEAARHWEILLRALERPGSPGVVRAAALGWFLGYTPAQLAEFDDEQLAAVHEKVRRWSVDLLERGVVGLMALARAGGLHSRLLAQPGGERNLTDVDHIAELLQGLTGGRPAPAAAVLSMLHTAGTGVDGELASEMLARRIDRDDDAVQVMTVHKAKGLEFPIVLCPYLWTTTSSPGRVPHAHDEGARWLDATWIADVASTQASARRFRALDRAESAGEGRRLVYVALTRARHRCIVWWAPVTTKGSSSLGELMEHRVGVPAEQPDQLQPLIDAGNGAISVCQIPSTRPTSPRSTRVVQASLDPHLDPLSVAVATRVLDRSWRIWSFSGITTRARQRLDAASIGSHTSVDTLLAIVADTGTGGGTDEPTDEHRPAHGEPMPAAALELTSAPAGTTFGTLVHEVLEVCDFGHPQLQTHLEELCDHALRYRPQPITPPALARGLAAAILAPLGGSLGTQRLCDLDRADRLDEMEFHLPLGRLRADDIGRALVEHLDQSDPFRPWAARLAQTGDLAELSSLGGSGVPTGFDIDLSGQLTGSIDLIGRTRIGPSGAHRYWLADYKSNQLGVGCGYQQADLVEAMVHHEYALQATLYLVALHRYLRWRIPGYRIQDHLGGAAYLFVRGMDPSRPSTDTRGVFWWQPAPAAIEALDRLFAQGAPQ